MNLAFFILPEVALAGWFLLNRWSASNVARTYSSEDAMLQNLRDYWREGYSSVSRAALLQLTQRASDTAFQCKQQGFFLPHRDGTWTLGESKILEDDSSLLTAIAAHGQPIDSREQNLSLPPDLRGPIYSLMERNGINVMVPVSDSVAPQWIWVSSLTNEHTQLELDSLRAWQMAMQSVVERETLLLASAHLEGLEKDAASATEVLQVLLPVTPHGQSFGLQWSGSLRRESGDPPLLFATYPQEKGKVLIVFSEVVAPGLAAVILGSALRGYCDSIVAASKGSELKPDEILKSLNQYVWRPESPSNLSCVVALFDTTAKRIDYACAGSPSWIEFQDGEAATAIAPTGAGLGAGDALEYKCERIDLKADAVHLFVSQHGLQHVTNPVLEQRVRANQNVTFKDLGQHTLGVAESMAALSEDNGPTPGVVLLRLRS